MPGSLAQPDAATCGHCLHELFDPEDRRYRYPFLNCSDCGPRFTVTRELPFDRASTTMDAFSMCRPCRAEYQNPEDRRFRTEQNACAICGPQLSLIEDGVPTADRESALKRGTFLLGRGGILAVKGVGGYQLFAAANDEAAVARLRRRKGKSHEPFALLVRDVETAAEFVQMNIIARSALTSPARPIVLLPRIVPSVMALGVAPGLGELGVMLPSSPLHHLLVAGDLRALAMTSADIGASRNLTAASLTDIADALLVHDREIHAEVDDSIVRIVAGGVQHVRRARGFVPDPIVLDTESPSVLALGGFGESTICVTRGRHAIVSAPIVDPHLTGQGPSDETIGRLLRLFGVTPAIIAHDAHDPRWQNVKKDTNVVRVAVQHHHAHVAACMAEHGCTRRVLGVVFDNEGHGPGGERWGGELLLADLAEFTRVGHLRALPVFGEMPSGLEPWRAGLAALIDAGEDLDVLAYIPHAAADVRDQALRFTAPTANEGARVARPDLPTTTCASRWIDAFAAIAGIRSIATYDAQAALELDAFATAFRTPEPFLRPYPYEVEDRAMTDEPFVFDLRPTVRAAASDIRDRLPRGAIALGVHRTFASIAVDAAERVRARHGIGTVVLTGGCFASRRLTETTKWDLEERGFEVLVHRRVPPTDAGLSLGQAAIASQRWQKTPSSLPPLPI